MPQYDFPTYLERPYGSLCGEGFSETQPPDSDLLTVIPNLRNTLVRVPFEVVELIEAYLPFAAGPARRCSISLYNHIDHGLSLCQSYCKAVAQAHPGFLVWWFLQECDLVEAAVTEYALALDALQKEMERIFPARKEGAAEGDRLRPRMTPLDRDLLVALARTTSVTEILLNTYHRVLQNAEGDPAALGVVFKPIMSLKAHLGPVFGTGKGGYKKLSVALKKCQAVPQKPKGQRWLVDVAAFLAWLDIVKSAGADMGFDPSGRSTWPDEVYDAITKELAVHLREKRTIREEKRRQNG